MVFIVFLIIFLSLNFQGGTYRGSTYWRLEVTASIVCLNIFYVDSYTLVQIFIKVRL